MSKSILLVFSTFLLTNLIYAQTEYYTGWDNTTENSGWTQIKKGDMGLYEWDLDASTSVSPDSCLAHYYPVGGSVPTDDWYVSPLFDFSAGGWIDTLWHNYNGFGTPMAGDTIVLYLLNGSSDPDLANKTVLYSFSDSTYTADNTWYELLMIPVGTHAGDSYLAFRYYTTNNWLDVKFDNLKVTSFSNASVVENNFEQYVSIFPNPSNSFINIGIDPEFRKDLKAIVIYDQSGRIIQNLALNTETIDFTDLQAGTYYIQFTTKNESFSKQIIYNP